MLKALWIFVACCVSLSAATVSCFKPVTFVDKRFKPRKSVLACNEQGDVAIAWRSSQGDQDESLFFTFKNGNGDWSPVKGVSENKRISKIKLTVGSEGKATLLWRERSDNKGYYFYGQNTEEEFWHVPLRQVNELSRVKAKLRGDKVIFTGTFEDLGDLIETTKSVPYQLVEIPFHLHALPDFYWGSAFDGNTEGNGLMVGYHREWREDYYWRKDFFAVKAFWLKNSAWSSPQKICELPQDEYVSQCKCLTAANDASSGVVWMMTHDPKWKFFLRGMMCSNGEWSLLEPLQMPTIHNWKWATNSQSDLFVVWKDYDAKTIAAALKSHGQEWRHFVLVSEKKHPTQLYQLKSDASGNFVVIWTDTFQATRNLHTERREGIYGAVFSIKDQTISDPVLLSPVTFDCSSPSLALTTEGHGFITWIASNGYDQAVQVAELAYTP